MPNGTVEQDIYFAMVDLLAPRRDHCCGHADGRPTPSQMTTPSTCPVVGGEIKGVKPADLPVEQPMKFELVVNLKTAKELGLTISPLIRFQADKVIQ